MFMLSGDLHLHSCETCQCYLLDKVRNSNAASKLDETFL